MIKNENIICISSIDWDFVWQGHQEIMNTFAENGNKVLFIENTGIRTPNFSDLPRIRKRLINWFRSFRGIRQETPNLFIYSPLVIPFPYSRPISILNRRILLGVLKHWMRATDFTDPIIWTFLPTRISIDLIKNIENKLSVYYCIADFDHLVRNKEKLAKSEGELLKTVDVVFAQGKFLKERCLKFNKNVSIFPFGVKKEVFESYKNDFAKKIPDDLATARGKKIGYIGGVHKHISFDLLEYVAAQRPEWSIILVGPDQVNYAAKEKPKNIIMLGMKKHNQLPAYINNMDVCIIPYEITSYTDTVFPTKLNEYLLTGKPVVSTALSEVKEFNRVHNNVVRIAESKEEFLSLVEKSLRDTDKALVPRRIEAALANTWENRIEEMSSLMQRRIEEKREISKLAWKKNLIKIYRRSKRRITITLAAASLLYAAVFYSPLVWFMAAPLKIEEPPRQADAIVVFGGGVGEGGYPGESTIERARFSVELYQKGFSKKIIYSSGYTFKYNDAENMKLFAISMDVPEENIILEKKSGSCYENVEYTNQILRKNNFKSIILVTSPYNMRRASLVYKKTGKGIDVTYVPVPRSLFYNRVKPVELKQIKAIIHEYRGIIYYYFKGYI